MKNKKLKLVIRELIITEIFKDLSYSYNYRKINSYEYISNTIENDEIKIYFEEMSAVQITRYINPLYHNTIISPIYNVIFTFNGSDVGDDNTISTEKLIKTLNTVITVIIDFINQNNPIGLFIHPTEKNQKLQKRDIYKYIISQSKSKFKNYIVTDEYNGGFLLLRNKF